MTLIEAYPYIINNPLFKNASPEELNKYISEDKFRICKFSPQEIICSPSTENIGVGFVITGIASVSSDSGNDKFLLRTLSDGDMFGISNLYSEEAPFPSIITAKTCVSCLFIEKQAFRLYIENTPSALRTYLRILNDKIIYLNRKITVFTAQNTEKKLAVFIFENQIDGNLTLPCSMSSLAERLGLGRASLYRAFDKLTEIGLIIRCDKQISVPSPQKLKYFFS